MEPLLKRPRTEVEWTQTQSLLRGTFLSVKSARIAAFDMDGTLITTKGSHVYARNANDWKWLYPDIPNKLRELHEKGFKVVVFSNQKGMMQKPDRMNTFKGRIEAITEALKIPIEAYAAGENDWFRKPRPGMWETFLTDSLSDIDYGSSFFVGDAAGRPDGWKPKAKKDFADTDRKFALNVGLTFYTPEEYFLGHSPSIYHLTFDPRNYPSSDVPFYLPDTPLVSTNQEIVILVGAPASGKSFFALKYLVSQGYVHINQDTLKTKAKCVNACKEAIALGKSCVVDNTNPDLASRKPYISVGQEKNVPIRCYEFFSSRDLCMHNDFFRSLVSKRPRLPEIAFYTFKSKYMKPSLEEGFDEVKTINFVPDFEKEEHKSIWSRFYV